ncbi:Glutathione S-transferase 2 [Steccherinum ochraceum]|uniref:glutathione transferase n=1 Tax=Steccherinum ochraceum TaxID=92696 RepID=A0A4R0R6T0_9APHY|nr:Glutathione S-transferase 2 [Steccherinum ochraceum]
MAQKHFTLWTHFAGPNGWKITSLLNELGLDYEPKYIDFFTNEQKGSEYLKINPNGRIPALIDHKNNDYIVWESAAIMLYIVDKYDTENRLNISAGDPERHHLYQWLFFQMSGQGPYMGQASWFNRNHPEKLPSAIERYQNETRRVLGVLESVLSKQQWLDGGKLTIADIIYVPWNNILGQVLGPEFSFEREFPATFKWHSQITALPGVKAGIKEKARLMDEFLKSRAK